MCGFLSSLALKIIIGILNVLIFLYGAGIISPMVILTSVGNSDVSEELKLGTPIQLGAVIGCFAIVAAILFYVTSCLVCLPGIIIRILVLVYCGIMVFKIVIEIFFLTNISMVQNSMNETLEKYLINVILRAGGQEELAEKDMTYKEFQALPNVSESNYACSGYCKLHMELMDEIQSRMECCGIESPNDWNKVPIGIPESCCTSSDCEEMRNDGCLGKVEDIIEKMVTILLYVVIAAIVLQISCIIFGYLLFKVVR